MSFNSNSDPAEYTATADQTEFPFTFKIFVNTDVKVYQTLSGETPNDEDDILILTADYTVAITGDTGGNLTLNTGASVGDKITIVRDLPVTRDTDYQTSGDLLSDTLNDDQDYQAYLIGDLSRKVDKVVKFPESAQGVNATLPDPDPLYYLRWNADGTAIENDLTPTWAEQVEESKDISVAAAVAAGASADSAGASADSAEEAKDIAVAIVTAPLVKAIGNINNPLLGLPLNNNLSMKQGVGDVTLTRATTKTYIDMLGVLQTASIDEACFESKGYRASVGSTNLLLQSEDFSTTWTNAETTESINTTEAPDGNTTADSLLDTVADASHRIQQTGVSVTSGNSYTLSVFAKDAGDGKYLQLYFPTGQFPSGYANFDLVNGTVTAQSAVDDATIIEVGNGWYRCSITDKATSTASSTQFITVVNSSTDTRAKAYLGTASTVFYIWGAQIEALPFITPYIPTTTTAVTRSADILILDSLNNMPNILDAITVMCDVEVVGTDGTYRKIFNSVDLVFFGSETNANDNLSGVYKATGSSTSFVIMPTTKFRLGATYNPTTATLRMYHDGVMVAEDTSASTSSARNALITLMSGVEGWITNLRTWNSVLTDEEIAIA